MAINRNSDTARLGDQWTVEMWSYKRMRLLSTLSFVSEERARYVTERGIRKFARHVPRAVLKDPDGIPKAVMTPAGGLYIWVEADVYRRFEASHQFCMPAEQGATQNGGDASQVDRDAKKKAA